MPERPTCGSPYPPGNYCVSTIDKVGFEDIAHSNYRLAQTSPYKGKASDGKDPGMDMDNLMSAIGTRTAVPDQSAR
jgi:hypothetical protein